MRLFGNSERRFALDADSAARIFKKEFNRALDALEDERERSTFHTYEYGGIDVFLDVHEAVYGYLANTNGSEASLTFAEWTLLKPDLDPVVAQLAQEELSNSGAIWHQNPDETAEALETENIEHRPAVADTAAVPGSNRPVKISLYSCALSDVHPNVWTGGSRQCLHYPSASRGMRFPLVRLVR